MSEAGSKGDAPTLYLIDGYAQIFRAYFAIRSQLSSPVTKEPTNATFGWTRMLLDVLAKHKPEYLAVVIDVSGDTETFRSELYPEYKAHRDPPPLDFGPQAERSIDIARRLGIPVLGVERYEADDVIATLVTRLAAEHPDLQIRIISKDKDLQQLLSDRVELYDVHKDERVTVESLREEKRIGPENVIDMLALMGDKVDNVPGVEGIGPKTAADLIAKYGSIEGIYEHLDEIKGKRRENLEKARDTIGLSRQLVTLCHDVDLDFDLEQARVDPSRIQVDEVVQLFKDLGFGRFRDELLELTGRKAPAEKASSPADSAGNTEGLLFAEAPGESTQAEIAEPTRGVYRVITTASDLKALVAELRSAEVIAVDTETTGLSPMEAALCGISLSTKSGTGAYVPVRSPDISMHLTEQEVIDALRPILEDASRPKTGHNLKYDLIILRRHGIRLRGIVSDTMVASYLVDSSRPSHGMDALAAALLHYRCIPITSLIGERTVKGRRVEQLRFDQVALDRAGEYAAEDADVSLRLHEHLYPEIRALGLEALYRDVEVPLVEVLAEMEYNGIRVDPTILDSQREALSERIAELRREIIDESPHSFNPDSPRQLAAALFNAPDDDPPGIGLKVIRRGKTGPSTDIEVLEKLAADPEVTSRVPQLIVEYRQLTKLVNTYLGALRDSINTKTGRVHASFHQTVAATGRLSSSDPNLQNIPIRTEVGRNIRRAFLADAGNLLISADYSQIELRILAHLCGDEALIRAFREDQDIHTAVAAEVYGVALKDVTREQRNSAKMVNFGIIYGITAFGLARRLGAGVSNEQAAQIIADYKARFSGIDAFLQQCVEQARSKGYVETMLKRRRPVPQVHSRNPNERNLGERIAINSVVQGSAADLIKVAMVNLHRRLPAVSPEARILLQIHDELVFEAPEGQAEAVRDFVVSEMESAFDLKVPLKVDSAISADWFSGK